MCSASLLHRDFGLATRAECGLCGFLTLDMFVMQANQRCDKFNQPKGSMSMAPQTTFNIQAVALSAVAIAASKPAGFHPWKCGSVRMSELAIEEWFSLLRAQSANSQLSARGYFAASTRAALKHGRQLNKVKATSFPEEPALSQEQRLGMPWNVWNCLLMFIADCFFLTVAY